MGSNISEQKQLSIYADSNADPEILGSLPIELSKRGMAFYFDEEDGTQVSRVQNYPSEKIVLNILGNIGAITGNTNITQINTDGIKKDAW